MSSTTQEVTGRTPWPFSNLPVTLQDVEFAYRLLLGRDVESAAVAQLRVGQAKEDMVFGFIESQEFANIPASLEATSCRKPHGLTEEASKELVDWTASFFNVDLSSCESAVRTTTILDLLVEVLSLTWVQRIADRSFGPRGGITLAKNFNVSSDRWKAAAAAFSRSLPSDISNLYRLLLDRDAETYQMIEVRLVDTPLAAAVTFLMSDEFARNFVDPVMKNLHRSTAGLAPEIVDWLVNTFSVDREVVSTRSQAIASILGIPAVKEALFNNSIEWNMDALIAQIHRLAPQDDIDATGKQPWNELLRASGLFDPTWYLIQNSDVRRAGEDPLDHFLHCGATEGRDPSVAFETSFYLESHPEVSTSNLSPIEHYLRIGQHLGFSIRGPSIFQRWLKRFDDLTESDRARIASDSASTSLPTLLCIQISDSQAAKMPQKPQQHLPDQIGVVPQIIKIESPGAAVEASERLKSLSDGMIVMLLGADVLLREHACFVIAKALAASNGVAAYSDNDVLDEHGQRSSPTFKPVMSRDLMVRLPYAGPLIAVRINSVTRELLLAAVSDVIDLGAAEAFSKLLLSCDDRKIVRVPLILFSVPSEPSPTGQEFERPTYEPVGCDVAAGQLSIPEKRPSVTILIPTRDRWELVQDCVDSIRSRTNYPRELYEIVVIDNGSVEPETKEYLTAFAEMPGCKVVSSPGSFNFARICNDGVAAAQGDVIVLLNNDTTVIESEWLSMLASNAMRPEIGIVGAQLLYPDDTVQHGGVLLGLGGVGGHRLIALPAEDAKKRDLTRQMTAVTGACLVVRREIFERLGGFNTVLGIAFNDVDLCIRVIEAGYRNLYVAQPLLYHHESKSRGLDDTRQKVERNAREAIYARRWHDAYFRDDPSYSPNLSLQRDGEIAFPPRVVRPWRRDPDRRHVLILSSAHGIGHGVGCVVAKQAAVFIERGWTVTVGGAVGITDRTYPGCGRVKLVTPEEAAVFAVENGVDCVIAHTPPFFSLTRILGQRPLFYAYDHGEPPPALFPDAQAREDVDWEKRFCVPLAKRVFVISQTIHDAQFRRDAIVLRNGNGHLASWSAEWAGRRAALRRKFGFEGRYVILNVCRFHEAERAYKGVDDYITLAHEAPYEVPGLANDAVFVLVGRGNDEDVVFVRNAGLTVFSNVTDVEMAELYAASDLYVNLSRWEGYNLGIGQALAMGLDVVASDIPAHREFGIPVASTQPRLCMLLGEAFARREEAARTRQAHVDDWNRPMTALVDIVEKDVAEDLAGHWL